MADRELLLERLERLAIVLDELMPQCAELVRDATELLKEQQEAKEVEAEVINEIDRLYRCPSCHISMILRGQPYCHSCGQKVKWK